MEENGDANVTANIKCNVCGESEFSLREGFYYCQECGTKQEQIRDVEVERDDDVNESKNLKKLKIKKLEPKKPLLTSWECYNYILRGLVEELLLLGAKEELKLMTLQVWAAYLRYSEVAFFNKKHAELPRLGVRFLKRDAETLYNHSQQKRKQRIRLRGGSDGDSNRDWRKAKRKLDETSYSAHSANTSNSAITSATSSANTSSTGTTTRAIPLRFSTKARKFFKKTMPLKHLKQHEMDAEGALNCHNLHPKKETMVRSMRAINTLNMKQIYAILAVALNLVEDDIQMSDLVRFIDEEQLSTKNVNTFFPENIAPHVNQLLKEINFFVYPEKYSDKTFREHVCFLLKSLNLQKLKKPDLCKLATRYISDLNLPQELAKAVERLINLLPAQMKTRVNHFYPHYEARAMAYVIYVLKLLFVLDGHKEKVISHHAKQMNEKLKELNKKDNNSEFPLLFVWNDWVEFIEMRKVIISHYNSSYCRRFQQHQSTAQWLEALQVEENLRKEQDTTDNKSTGCDTRLHNMQSIFNSFLQSLEDGTEDCVDHISFPASLTPSHSYFKRILLHCSNAAVSTSLNIPEFMRVDHTLRAMQPFLHANPLKQFLARHDVDMKIMPIGCTSNRNFVGVFRGPPDTTNFFGGKANFNISVEEWSRDLRPDTFEDGLEFKTKLEKYKKDHFYELKKKERMSDLTTDKGEPKWLSECQSFLRSYFQKDNTVSKNDETTPRRETSLSQNHETDNLSVYSFNAFKETNMEPLQNLSLIVPRRHLDSVDLFANLSDSEDIPVAQSAQNDTEIIVEETLNNQAMVLALSKMEFWMLAGNLNNFKDASKKSLEHKFPRSFFWLLQTCAQMLGIEWHILYEQLLVIETMFAHGIEDLNDFKDCIHFKYDNPIKEVNVLINTYRDIW